MSDYRLYTYGLFRAFYGSSLPHLVSLFARLGIPDSALVRFYPDDKRLELCGRPPPL